MYNQTRQAFIDFFVKNDHLAIPSSSLIPKNDPTLMFTNAGMVQFKDIFTGQEKPKSSTAVTTQKCVRAGGKHNDLDNVGYTNRHHTFFEMLGNFSFGDYFKEKAILHAYNFLLKEIGLPKDKLYVTVYHNDDEAYNLWKSIAGFGDDRIIRISSNDNFWMMGDTGPCGPCSEIFYDYGDKVTGGLPGTAEQDGDRYTEIWNLVFMQYNQKPGGKRENLPSPSIDTGMGMERLMSVLEGAMDNYKTSLFKKLINTSEELTGKSGKEYKTHHRVIADHIRSTSFLIADGVTPSNEGRGYVLRRIMRRAMRYLHQLDHKNVLMHKILPSLVEEMGKAYPELLRNQEMISETIRQEEERFKITLSDGIKLLEDELARDPVNKKFNGAVAFKLYDTYGFPLDLTQDILRSKNITVDQEEFDGEMKKQKDRSKKNWTGSGEEKVSDIWFEVKAKVPETQFIGYYFTTASAKVVSIVADGKIVAELEAGQNGYLVFEHTPFYAESGGQCGDSGVVKRDNQVIANVVDTQKFAGSIIGHKVENIVSSIKVGDEVELEVSEFLRAQTAANHTATHLLHAALRQRFGGQLVQKGSLVTPERLRFDFSHNKPLTSEDIIAIESVVNEQIRHAIVSNIQTTSMEKALEAGALALFGEKYADDVRVVKIEGFSTELCGGTHVANTGNIGIFKIVSEAGIAAGIRRIEAVTGLAALNSIQENEAAIEKIMIDNKLSKISDIGDTIINLKETNKKLQQEISNIKLSEFISSIPTAIVEGNYRKIYHFIENNDTKILPQISNHVKAKGDADAYIVASVDSAGGKASIQYFSFHPELKANELISEIGGKLGAKGGGNPSFASAGIGNLTPELVVKIKGMFAWK